MNLLFSKKNQKINQNFRDKIEKAEQEKVLQLEEVTKLKEKRISDEQQEKEKINQKNLQKSKNSIEKCQKVFIKKIKNY